MQVSIKGIVLREVKTGEADKILTILTEEYGVISAAAKGSRRLKSKLFAGTGIFCYSEFVLFEGKTMYSVNEATSLEVFFGLRETIEGMSLAMYISEIAQTISPTGTEAKNILKLLLNTFHLIATEYKTRNILQLKTIFEIRALTETGFMPSLVACQKCGEFECDSYSLDTLSGDFICYKCAKHCGRAINISGPQMAALRHIVFSDFEKIYSFSLSQTQIKSLSEFSSLYVRTQLGHKFKTLSFFETLI